MGRTVALIIGAAYSGSSLLNLLLDAQPGIRGLGEALHLITGSDAAHCAICAKPVRGCPVRAAIGPDRFYGSVFDYYGDCEVLIDSSKTIQGSLAIHPFEWDLSYRVLLLTKAPHEFIWSYLHHHQGYTIESVFRLYLDFYSEQMANLSGHSWYRPCYCLRITYRRLVFRTEETLRTILTFLQRENDPTKLTWQTDTHIIGGNWMVTTQLREPQGAFIEDNDYLHGKYKGKYHKIFYDDQWKSDKSFIQTCLQLYNIYQEQLRITLDNIGQPDFMQQVRDLCAML